MCVSNTALPAHNVPILHQRRFDKLWVGVKELAVLSLALASQKIATNLDILLLLTHSRQLHLLQRVAAYASHMRVKSTRDVKVVALLLGDGIQRCVFA